MSFPFSAWDYRHYSLLHAEEEATYYNLFIQLMEKKCLGPRPAARGRPRFVACEFISGENSVDLHKRVVEEQKEFATSFRDLPDVRESYGIIHPDALRFAKECLRQDLERLLHYPSHFEPHSELPLDCLNESLPRLLATPLQLGCCPVLKRPALDEDCSVEIDYGQLARRFLCKDTKEAGVHPSIGVTPKAGQDTKEEPELIDDLFGPVKDMETFGVEPKIVPLSPLGGSEGAPQECSGAAPLSGGAIEEAHLDCSSAASVPGEGNERVPPECSGTAPLSRNGSEGAPPEHSSAAPALKNILPDSAASPDRTEVKLMSPRLRSSSRSPTKRIPTTPRGSAESGCSCSSRIVTRRAKQQCIVLSKLDYNAKYGAEAFTRAELVRQMAHLVFIPNSHLLRGESLLLPATRSY
ncbi:hypothetical protein IscW_ISCW001239 [Ixodes scapularis]|uniref:Uncharacterized protein n=1 Tax=Ixodes scapularis TaxID=6945 RepID=B7P1Y5_IXOSC|nr:hypothetical protein IscW_ISCW001239 [Ixodes scapularis]|eukprot:XP_002400944.1 hypothetical protein IscW_ISCW001239 [Ixodes scapularis]